MKLDGLEVKLKVERINCFSGGDGWGKAEPYLWTIFFNISGTHLKQAGNRLTGHPEISCSQGSHRNLTENSVDGGEIVNVPEKIGTWQTQLQPFIFRDENTGEPVELPGFVGLLCVLLEQDLSSYEGTEAAHQAVNREVEQALHQAVSDIQIADLSSVADTEFAIRQQLVTQLEQVKSRLMDIIRQAAKKAQNLWQNLLHWINPDDLIGCEIFVFSQREILHRGLNISLARRWHNEGDWEMWVRLSAEMICPVKALNELLARQKLPVTDKSLFYRFRNKEYMQYAGLSHWWHLLERNSGYILLLIARYPGLLERLCAIAHHIEAQLQAKHEQLSEDFFEDVYWVLDRLQEADFRRLRIDTHKVRLIIKKIRSKSFEESLKILSENKPMAVES